MFRQLRNRGIRVMYLSMMIFSLSGIALLVTPGSASAQYQFDPTTNPNCVVVDDRAECNILFDTITFNESETKTETCYLGWSHRKATWEVTTSKVGYIEKYQNQQWYYAEFAGYWMLGDTEFYEDDSNLTTTVVTTDCRPITGRPPKS